LSFWEQAKDKKRKHPERLLASRGELGSAERTPCKTYGHWEGYNYQAHALYVRWTENKITAKEALLRLRKLGREFPGH